ncbi:MmcQ/YjbR family DNA-binding protein [Actinopolymorpha alba]|uniref:MmcQ/YjbR family DNA-binding protein n=1 Tax=Actinopolymorpha alba TaxID=533267 RepID=UPI00037D2F53|nr:MmcQ/YjbR family DNA-binding protein [Actinopolymorpha alba]
MTTRAWDHVQAFALGLPRAVEDIPRGELVVKVDHPPRRMANGLVYGPMFLWLGRRKAPVPAVSVKLKASYDQAVAVGRATPMTMSGLGQWGWLTVPLAGVDLDLLCDWIDESYRNVAPKKLVAELNQVLSAT